MDLLIEWLEVTMENPGCQIFFFLTIRNISTLLDEIKISLLLFHLAIQRSYCNTLDPGTDWYLREEHHS